MILLILGVALWSAAHLFKRVAPDARVRMGDGGRGAVALALVASILLMILGYRMADGPYWWGATPMLKGINNLLVLVAVYLFAASGAKSWLGQRMRHPMLTGTALWAFAHILPNGDLPSLVLFGGLLAWALVEMAVINRAEPGWRAPDPVLVPRKEITTALSAIVVFVIVGLIHRWLGYDPFGG